MEFISMYGLGVDLGTSFVAAAVAGGGAVDMVRLSGPATVVPSVAYLDERDGLLTGEPADRLGLAAPARSAREFKRRLGDPTPMILAGAPHSPTALMAAQLAGVIESVTAARHGPPARLVLTHPAVWGPYRREQFAAVPHLAGLPPPTDRATDPTTDPPVAAGPGAGPTVRLVSEPVAAVTYYSSTRPLPPDGLLAVYDLGGGTFDTAVVRNAHTGLEILGAAEGIEWLGGADFDQALLTHVDQRLDAALTALDPADPATAPTLATVVRECTRAKEALSTRESAEITVPLAGSTRQVVVTREAFEKMIAPSLDATVEAFRRMLTAVGVTPQELTGVLLVGGSSQIPSVSRVLREAIARPILIDTHPKHAVALGAAMLAVDPPGQRSIPGASSAAPDDGRTTATPVPPTPVSSAAPAAPAPAGVGATRRPVLRRILPVLLVVTVVALAALALTRVVPPDRDGARPPATNSPAPSTGDPSPTGGASSTSGPPRTGTVPVPPGGTGQIRSLATGMCVDSGPGAPSDGAAFAAGCDGGPNQKWREGPLLSRDPSPGTSDFRLLNQQTGFCLDANAEGGVFALPCQNPSENQVWQRKALNPPGGPPGGGPPASRSAGAGPPPGWSPAGGVVVAYQSRATGRCLSIDLTDRTLRTLPCSAGGFAQSMIFQRFP